MSPLNPAEEAKLAIMYEGDRNRDASSAIRGFLYQDYITIDCLLRPEVEYVCSEYLEDVDVFYRDGEFEFIQVKYYPKKDPVMKEICTDLYFQYLRLRMLDSTLKPKPRLYIHGKKKVEKPEYTDVKAYVGLGDALLQTAAYPPVTEAGTWLREHVYLKENKQEPEQNGQEKPKKRKPEKKKQNKAEQKTSLFTHMAAEDSLTAFTDALKVENPAGIEEYRQELMNTLAAAYPDPEQETDEEDWERILLGLAITRVQQRYLLEDPEFEDLRIGKEEFDTYMRQSARMKTEGTIAAYLVGCAADVYQEIIDHNDLSDLQHLLLNRIYRNTIQWIGQNGADPKGQFRLLNTLSKESAARVTNYKNQGIEDRLSAVLKCYDGLIDFFSYLWKIMLNICQERIKDQKEIQTHAALLDPGHYVDPEVSDYICLYFPGDCVRHSVILPTVNGRSRTVAQKIVSRMVNLREDVPKPEKWFFGNYSNREILRGKYDYDLNMADVKEESTVVDMEKDSFYIECMNCININAGGWNQRESCGDCIFLEKCVEEGR